MAEARLDAKGDGLFELYGELTFVTVATLWRNSSGLFDQTDDVVIDLAGVTRADSAGLALLVDWMRTAGRKKKNIHFRGMPEQILAMARVSGVEDILPVE